MPQKTLLHPFCAATVFSVSCQILLASPDFTSVTIDLEVYDLKHLTAIISQLRAKSIISAVERVNG